jgi:hypothetical protein
MPNINKINTNVTTPLSFGEGLGVRSENITELISSKPPWLVRRGITLFFFIVLALVAGTWFIQYPDVVNVQARVQAVHPPMEVISKTGGRLIKLFKGDGWDVNKNDVIGYIESNGNHAEILELSTMLEQLKSLVDNGALEDLPTVWEAQHKSYSNLGELQAPHQSFMQAFFVFKNYLSNGFYASKKQMLRRDLVNIKKLYGNLLTQKNLQNQDLALAEKNYAVNDTMHKEQLINDFDMRGQKSQLLNKKMGIPQMSASIIGNESQQNAIEKEMMDLDNQIVQQKNIFVQALFTHYNLVQDWKQKYLLLAPIKGKIAFATFLDENQIVVANKPVCYITNDSNKYSVEILIPNYVVHKIKAGMEVGFKFQGYPYQEYGTVKGTIEFIKNIPVDSGFVARVTLPNGLTTNTNKQIIFRNGLTATGEIFTENKRLLQKILNGVLKK